ncbi:hypothetical protein GCM10018782_12940 [Streptomyces griseoaurantiacus]|nr:hypothetical protein GCM10018782_12940 [Streptomyces griseoaurantiacus]
MSGCTLMCAAISLYDQRRFSVIGAPPRERPAAARTGRRGSRALRSAITRACLPIPVCRATPCTHSRRAGSCPTYNQYEGQEPARRQHAPDAARPALRADDGNWQTGPSLCGVNDTG